MSEDDHIEFDIKLLKNELEGLTRAQRCIILEEYLEKLTAGA